MLSSTASAARGSRAWLRSWSKASNSERALGVVTALIVVTGLFLRVRGYLFRAQAFSLDECGWAMLFAEQPLSELALRPLGFIFTSQAVAHVFGLTEMPLRALPWLAGMATTVLAVPLSRYLFRSGAARLLFVFILALHPCAIDFSKEFKPYSISLFLHLSLLLLALRYLELPTTRRLTWVLATALLGGFFAQDLVFAYPGLFVLLGFSALRKDRRHLLALAGGAGAIVLSLVAQYLLLWRYVTTHDVDDWAAKYSVFYTRDTGQSFAAWALHHYYEMAGFPGFRRALWRPGPLDRQALELLVSVDAAVWAILHLLGVAVLLRRRRTEAVLLLTPLATLWLFNLLRVWPIGVFRANIFVIGYFAAVACMAFEGARSATPRLWDALPALVLVFVPLAVLDRNWSAKKGALTSGSTFPDALDELLQLKRADKHGRETLLLDRRSCEPYRYYTEFHPAVRARVGAQLKSQFDVRCVGMDESFRAVLEAATPPAPAEVWAIVSNDREVRHELRRGRFTTGKMRHVTYEGSHHVLAFSRAHD